MHVRCFRAPLIFFRSFSDILNTVGVTNFIGKIYANPSRDLYKVLGMTIETLRGTPKGEKARSYIPSGFLVDALSSIWVRCYLSVSRFRDKFIFDLVFSEVPFTILCILENRATYHNSVVISCLALVRKVFRLYAT